MGRLVIVFLVATILFALMRILLAKQKLNIHQFFGLYFVALAGIALLFLGVTGRLHPVFAVAGVVLPFIGRIIPWIGRAFTAVNLFKTFRNLGGSIAGAGSTSSGPAQSEITTKFIHMVLIHDTGMMDGKVLMGQFKDEALSNLSLENLLVLLRECQQDGDSVNILQAYLDREHPEWSEQESRTQPAGSEQMDRQQALDILGLENTAVKEDVIAAHRKLMQKMHPDRGGSTYLAARINEAKDFLVRLLDNDRE